MGAIRALDRMAESSATSINLFGRMFSSVKDIEVASISADLLVRMASSLVILEQVYGFAGRHTGSPDEVGAEPIDRHWAGTMRNRKDVVSMLSARPELEPILCQIHDEVAARFPEARIVLEGEPDSGLFYVVVETGIGVASARDALEAFDREWWLESAAATGGAVCVTVDLV